MSERHKVQEPEAFQSITSGPVSTDRLLPVVYEELRRLARAAMAKEPPGHTLQPTALVHQAYLRLVENGGKQWNGRGHFFCAAAQAMRRILVERARKYQCVKHGAGRQRWQLESAQLASDGMDFDLLALDEALDKLREIDARKSEIVALRYFAGLTIEETAAALGLSETVIKGEWRYAKAWLHRELSGE